MVPIFIKRNSIPLVNSAFKGDARQASAITKHSMADAFYALRQRDACKVTAFFKHTIANASYTVWYCDTR